MRRGDAVVAAAFALLLAAFVAVSWAKWPLVTADSARELYVPFQIGHGALIYRDFAYLYGPVAPYLQAGLLGLFGPHLEVLYVASLGSLALTMALLYALARQVLGVGASAAVLWIFFTHFALGRDIAGYVWPYAFAATDAVLWGVTLVLLLASHARAPQRWKLALGGVMLGLSLVTKLEYGVAAAGIAVVYGALRALARPGWRGWAADALALALPALAVAGAIAGTVLAHVPWPVVQASVWPTELMKLWNSQGTWHGTPRDWLWNGQWLVLALAVMGLALGHERLWQGLRGREPLALAAAALLLALVGYFATAGRFFPLHAPWYWPGPGFLVMYAILGLAGRRAYAAWRAGEPLDAESAVWLLVAAYGCLAAIRTLMHGYNEYTRYQAPVALIGWVGLATVFLPRLTGWRPRCAGLCLAAVVGVLGGFNAAHEIGGYLQPHERVGGPMGTVLAEPRYAGPYLAALGYVRAHTHPGDAIVAAPMEASFYLFTGLDNVLHEDQLFLGYLTTEAEQRAAIAHMEARRVRYVLVSNYGHERADFGVGYMPLLGQWLARRCRVVVDHGSQEGYRVRVYATPYASEMARFTAPALALAGMLTPEDRP